MILTQVEFLSLLTFSYVKDNPWLWADSSNVFLFWFDNKLVFTANGFVSWQTLYPYFLKVCTFWMAIIQVFTANVFNSVSKICSV